MKGSVKVPLFSVKLSPKVVFIISSVIIAIASGALVYGLQGDIFPVLKAVKGVADAGYFMLGLYLAFFLLEFLHAGILKSEVDATSPLFGFHAFIPVAEKAAWAAGVSSSAAVALFIFSGSVIFLSYSLSGIFPPLTAGVFTGALLDLLRNLFPLSPGPLEAIVERFTGIRDYWKALRLSLITRFLPFSTSLQFSGSGIMALLAAWFAVWVGAAGSLFYFITLSPSAGLTQGAFVLKLFLEILFAGYFVWLVKEVVMLFREAWIFKQSLKVKVIENGDQIEKDFMEKSALISHLPELQKVVWEWIEVPPGFHLIKMGSEDRDFYWIAQGEVRVIGRNERGDPVHLATLRGNSGVGEIALLKGVKRTADVVVTEPSVLGVLRYTEFEKIKDNDVEERLKQFVVASQAFSSSEVFSGMPPEEKEMWLSEGEILTFSPGDVVVEEGGEDYWMGLIVDGDAEVIRGGKKIAQLSRGDVFGEVAFLKKVPRTATITANSRLVVMKWKEKFLDSVQLHSHVKEALEALMVGREGETR